MEKFHLFVNAVTHYVIYFGKPSFMQSGRSPKSQSTRGKANKHKKKKKKPDSQLINRAKRQPALFRVHQCS